MIIEKKEEVLEKLGFTFYSFFDHWEGETHLSISFDGEEIFESVNDEEGYIRKIDFLYSEHCVERVAK